MQLFKYCSHSPLLNSFVHFCKGKQLLKEPLGYKVKNNKKEERDGGVGITMTRICKRKEIQRISISIKCFFFFFLLVQECPKSVLEGHCPAEFSSNLPQHTCLEVSSMPNKICDMMCLIGDGAEFCRTVALQEDRH